MQGSRRGNNITPRRMRDSDVETKKPYYGFVYTYRQARKIFQGTPQNDLLLLQRVRVADIAAAEVFESIYKCSNTEREDSSWRGLQ